MNDRDDCDHDRDGRGCISRHADGDAGDHGDRLLELAHILRDYAHVHVRDRGRGYDRGDDDAQTQKYPLN